MREILFRGKRVDNGEWVEGFYHYSKLINSTTREHIKTTHWILPIGGQDAYDIIPESISEFTGLTDKNGTKIFEGDIIKAWGQRPMYVHFNEETLTLEMTDVGVPIFKVNHLLNTMDLAEVQVEAVVGEMHTEVIGNIHDNPELLKGDCDNA